MRIGILAYNQSAFESPRRHVSKSVAALLVRRLTAERIAKNLIRELAVHSIPSSDPQRFLRGVATPVIVVPGLLPPRRPEGLLLQYPVADQSSYAQRNRKRIWGTANGAEL